MAIDPGYVGRSFRIPEPYEVSRVKIAEFADAIGDPSPLYRDRATARAAGYPDVIAPPTFAFVLSLRATGQAVADPGLGLNYARVVHGEQRFEYARPIAAGDVLTAEATVTDVRTAGSLVLFGTSTAIATVAGEHVCTAYSLLVERGGQEAGAR